MHHSSSAKDGAERQTRACTYRRSAAASQLAPPPRLIRTRPRALVPALALRVLGLGVERESARDLQGRVEGGDGVFLCVWVTCASWFLVVSGRLERIRAFRRQLRIKVSGAAISDPIHTFPEMKVATRRAKGILLHNIEESGTAQPIATTCFV